MSCSRVSLQPRAVGSSPRRHEPSRTCASPRTSASNLHSSRSDVALVCRAETPPTMEPPAVLVRARGCRRALIRSHALSTGVEGRRRRCRDLLHGMRGEGPERSPSSCSKPKRSRISSVRAFRRTSASMSFPTRSGWSCATQPVREIEARSRLDRERLQAAASIEVPGRPWAWSARHFDGRCGLRARSRSNRDRASISRTGCGDSGAAPGPIGTNEAWRRSSAEREDTRDPRPVQDSRSDVRDARRRASLPGPLGACREEDRCDVRTPPRGRVPRACERTRARRHPRARTGAQSCRRRRRVLGS